jgi:hypothetical protein
MQNALALFAQRSVREVDSYAKNLAFHNFVPNSIAVPPALNRLLGLNLNFCPTPRPLQPDTLQAAFSEFTRNLRLRLQFGDSDRGEYNKSIYVANKSYQPRTASPIIEAKLNEVRSALGLFQWSQGSKKNLNTFQQSTLRILRSRPDLRVVQTDKNLGPALFTHERYIKLCLEHLNDRQTYAPITAPSSAITKLIRSRVRNYYEAIARSYAYNDDWSTTKIIVSDLDNKSLNRFYGLAKIHKPKLCIRPIISNSGGILEGLSKWLNFQLQPLFRSTKSYIRSSDQLLTDLPTLTAEDTDILLTMDVESLYTSIPTTRALQILGDLTRTHPWGPAISKGLELVMKSNYFMFGDTIWHQLQGTAMGTSVAPAYASLYVAYFEDQLLEEFDRYIVYYKRYIDDIFVIWRPNGDPFAHKRFIAKLQVKSKLKLTSEVHQREVAFLDLWICKQNRSFYTKTHQKKLNLYLYLPANSAHPPGVLKGLIKGLIQKYRLQNPRPRDFKKIVKLFYKRLTARGYKPSTLLPLFHDALDDKNTSPQSKQPIVFKLPFDPNGPSRASLRSVLQLDTFQELSGSTIKICYTKPRTLRSILCPTDLKPMSRPTPAEAIASVQEWGVNPKP